MVQELSVRRGVMLLSQVLGWGLLVSPVGANPVPIAGDLAIASQPKGDRTVCPAFSAIANGVKPTIPSLAKDETLSAPTSACAADLDFLPKDETLKPSKANFFLTQDQPASPELTSPPPDPTLQISENSDRWHFKFQPYATIPVSTYGSATVKGRTVGYSLGLGELLESLRMTASGRLEAWKGRWGFIVDGYYASLQGIGSFEKVATRAPQPISVVDYVLSKGINTKVTQLATDLDREVQALKEVEEIKNSPALQQLDQDVQTLQATLTRDAEEFQNLATNVKSFQETLAQDEQQLQILATTIQSSLQDLPITPSEKQDIGRAISLNSSLLQDQEQLQSLQQQIQSLGVVPKLDQVQQDLSQIQSTLEASEQKVQELRQIEDSPQLQQLEADIIQAKTLVEKELQDIEKAQTFQENREPQQLDADINTDLKFDQGIYDFALSYHFGDEPSYQLPEQPSGRSFPLVWFQPIAGVRLNDINIQIENTIDYQISSSLVNIQGTLQNTYQGGRTWFEPMLGGKFGLQLSDPWTLWLRGDVSGFGLAGDTDLSWNLFFGVDWWVKKSLSLQLAYHFYAIDYQNGTGDNAFGLEENFNGPYVAATVHF